MNQLFEYIILATKAGMLKWEPTGKVERVLGALAELRGWTTQFNGFRLTTIADREKEVYGLRVERGEQKHTFTSNPKQLPGEKEGRDDNLLGLVSIVHYENGGDLEGALRHRLCRVFPDDL